MYVLENLLKTSGHGQKFIKNYANLKNHKSNVSNHLAQLNKFIHKYSLKLQSFATIVFLYTSRIQD